MISWKMRAGLLAALLLMPCSSLLRQSGAAEPLRVLDLALSNEGEGRFRLHLKTSGPISLSRCRIRESGSASFLVLEFPNSESGLKPSYEFPQATVGTAKVTPIGGQGESGWRVEIPLKGMALLGWETAGEGMSLFLSAATATPPAAAAARIPYRLGVGDRLELSVYGHEDLHQELEILSDGTVILPMVGVVSVEGKTLSELREELEVKLKDFLVDPQVSLDVKEYRSQPVNVVGEVEKPGPYFLKGPTTLVDIIAQAGWMTREAGSEVIITRHEEAPGKGTQMRQIVVRKEDLVGSGQANNNPLIQAGDVVTVGPKQYFYIRGEVSQPGQYALENHPTLMKAISIAQGLTPFARKKGIELIRTVNGVPTTTVIDLKAIEEHKLEDIPLQMDDQILVPRRMF